MSSPAEIYMRLKLMELAIKRALPDAAEAAEAQRASVSAKTLELDHGTLTVARPKPAVSVDPDGLLEWVKANRPDEIRETVNPAFVKAYTESLTIVDGEAVDKDGTVVDFAHVVQRRPYLTVKFAEGVKDAAVGQIVAAVESWQPLGVEQ